MCIIEQLFSLEGGCFFNSACAKTDGNTLETQDQYALELFAPELFHQSRNCSNVHSPEVEFVPRSQSLFGIRNTLPNRIKAPFI
jgi:hypothetical protein